MKKSQKAINYIKKALYEIKRPADFQKDKAVILLIDMQEKFLKEILEPERLEKLLLNQEKAIYRATKLHIPIIFSEYSGYGETNKRLKYKIEESPYKKRIEKNRDSVFSNKILTM